jgi:hypothetical protein
VFLVSTLKKFVGTPPAALPPLPDIHHDTVVVVPARVEQARLARGVCQVLVHWQGEPPSSTIEEDMEKFHEKYLAFQLEDERDLEGGEMLCGATRIYVSDGPVTSGGPRHGLQRQPRPHPAREGEPAKDMG